MFQSFIALGHLSFVPFEVFGSFLPALLVQLEDVIAVLLDECRKATLDG
jgi:hypothetical protein